MIDAAQAVTDSIVATLKATAAVTAIVGQRVYSERAPQGAAFPYITLGDPQTLSFSNKDDEGSSTFIDVHGWVRASATDASFMRRGLTLRAAIVAALDQTRPTIADYFVQQIWVTDTRILRDPDGTTAHVIVTVQADLTPDP